MSQAVNVHSRSKWDEGRGSRGFTFLFWFTLVAVLAVVGSTYMSIAVRGDTNAGETAIGLTANPELSAARRFAEAFAKAVSPYQNPELWMVAAQVMIQDGRSTGEFLSDNPEIMIHRGYLGSEIR